MFFTWNFVLRIISIIQDFYYEIIVVIYDVLVFADTS